MNYSKVLYYSVLVGWLLNLGNAYSSTWTRTFGDTADDCGYSICLSEDSGYILAGYTESYGAGMTDVWLIKTDSTGVLIWDKTFGGPDSECAYSIQRTVDDGYIIAGYTKSFGAGESDVWLIKTDTDGDTLWTRTYGDFGNEYAYSVAETADSGYIVVGTKDYKDAWLIKVDINGDTLWTRSFEGYDFGRCVQQTQDSGYIITGYANSLEFGGIDGWLIKTDINGDTLWTRVFGESGDDYLYSVGQTKDNGYIMTGSTDENVGIIKTDSFGNDFGYFKTYLLRGTGYSIRETKSNEYIIVGLGCWCEYNNYGALIIKPEFLPYPDCGEYETFGGKYVDGAHSFQQIGDRTYIMVGFTKSYGEGKKDLWLIRTEENTWNWYGPGVEETSLQESSPLLSVFPNPVISFAGVRFSCNNQEKVKLSLYDITGRERMLLFEGNVSKGENTITLNTKGLVSGKYFLRLEGKDSCITKDIIIVR